jgi:hypothetical protein
MPSDSDEEAFLVNRAREIGQEISEAADAAYGSLAEQIVGTVE